MQKIHEPKKLFIGNVKITEICYRHFSKKKKKKKPQKTQKNKQKTYDILIFPRDYLPILLPLQTNLKFQMS